MALKCIDVPSSCVDGAVNRVDKRNRESERRCLSVSGTPNREMVDCAGFALTPVGVWSHSLRRRLSYGAKPLKKAAGAAGATHRTHAKAGKSAPRGFTQSAHVLPVVTRTKPVAKPARPRSRSRSPK